MYSDKPASHTSMENLGLNVSTALENLCKHNVVCAAELQGFLAKQIWTPGDRSRLLEQLAQCVARPDCAVDILRAFRSLTLDLLQRAECNVHQQGMLDWIQHQNFCVALSKVLHITEDAVRFAANYLVHHEPFYRTSSHRIQEPQCKKARKKKGKSPRKKELVRAVWRFVQVLCTPLRDAWDWEDFLSFLTDNDKPTRWFAVQSIIKLVGLTPSEQYVLVMHHFTPDEYKTLSVRYSSHQQQQHEQVQLMVNPEHSLEASSDVLTYTKHHVVEADLCGTVVSVSGVLIPKIPTAHKDESDTLVPVQSLQRNLRSLALAVASGAPCLLQGPVGCGKTALVEHLATLTGRSGAPDLLKVQLGDQTDSKALLGTYRCTSVPGEFVWQAGSLTRAVTEGHWILLEDIDYAPMDVVSVLLPLLQSGSLSLPGHGDCITPAPGFRLFATQRLLGSGGTLYKMHCAGADILERMWTKVAVEPMAREELSQVIITKHPQLMTVKERLLDVYFLLSAGRHGNATNGNCQDADIGKFLSHDGRLISTRDLMKWCDRIAIDFDVSKTHTANLVFQEAFDCFCACLAKADNRLPLAEAIGAKLNLTKAKAEFYCTTYKPNVEVSALRFSVGRVSLQKRPQELAQIQRFQSSSFAFTRVAVTLLERVGLCVANMEPVLLVGETGTGKTSSVQYLAEQMGHNLRVINMNQQSDSTDLLGGFKPVDLRLVISPVREVFETLFCQTFSRKQNIKFLSHIQECFARRKWLDLLKLMEHSQKAAIHKFEEGTEERVKWEDVGESLSRLRAQVRQAQSALAFTFIEGSLVQALRRGDWVLLDEINLATAETLECLSGLLESTSGSVVLMERGDTEPVIRHPNFRLFACMNPATDVGKKDLPPGIRNRFTELYVDELEDAADLKVLVAEYMKGLSLTAAHLDNIVKFYLIIRSEAAKRLTDGTGHRPHYSLRTLCRALRHASRNLCNNVSRSLYEGFCLSFLTELDRSSHPVVEELICHHVVGKSNIKGLLKQRIPEPMGHPHLKFEGFWVATGPMEPHVPDSYVLTPSVRANLRDLARVVAAGRHPVLLQGETSVGKTSLITWLAAATGNVCMRINNHEHTDLQEYMGCYAADETGKLIFKEGILVEAMKKGHWIILDELNLAPTDVLEALNRLLDDNRELFIAETQEVVKAHPHFMLFATQNPPGFYGGRKVLSRAFRNRFIELHFDDIPSGELETILHERCSLPPSYAKRLVAVMLELQTRRRGSGVFAGKQGFITLRDLFRWAERYRQASYETSEKFFDWDQQLADNGFMLLAGRCRKPEESAVIRKVIEKHLRRSVNPVQLFTLTDDTSPTTASLLQPLFGTPCGGFEHVVWTYNMRRMAVLVGQALKFSEPVLLVGETGCGKTTVCQMYAALHSQKLHSVNCHLHTESADFLGGLRPVRHSHQESEEESQRLFEWNDGPLVMAMRFGTMFLIDEISLADDSVLERLNSVLELERTLVLAEKGSGDGGQNEVDVITAEKGFRVVATMNPGGDYGKKELSPALRNRFTEIWCPQSGSLADLVAIIEHNITPGIRLGDQGDGSSRSGVGNAIIDFISWFSNNDLGRRSTVSIRDILTWVSFINATVKPALADSDMEVGSVGTVRLEPAVAYIHGACMVFLDALGSGGTGGDGGNPVLARQSCVEYLIKQVADITGQRLGVADLGLLTCAGSSPGSTMVVSTEDLFGIPPFVIPKGDENTIGTEQYALDAPTTSMNAQRVIRALQLPRPILLEGSPGVGKTSLVSAIAKAAGHKLVRINLSEQTDVADLFGADLPVEGGTGGQFAWRDGPLLRALKAGHWVVFDELNLASQSVLEGLNACLDHRAEVYVPELGQRFQVQEGKTRLFACQNPLHQGGGRKGLPRSFLNRFTQVYVEPLSRADLLFITHTVYPNLPAEVLENMVDFNHQVCRQTMDQRQWGQRGSPWEFNLRDIFRWCDLLTANQVDGRWDPGEYMGLIYAARMRTSSDKARMISLYQEMFHSSRPPYTPQGDLHVTSMLLQVGHVFLPRRTVVTDVTSVSMPDLRLLHHSLRPLEDVMKCISMNWMAILVGPASCGKTSLVQLLAQLTGHPLHILPMNSDMDTTELLGGFEQADLNRHLEEVIRSVRTVLHQITGRLLVANQDGSCCQAQRLLGSWNKYTAFCTNCDSTSTSGEAEILTRKLTRVKDIVMELGEVNEKYAMEHKEELKKTLVSVERVHSQLSRTGTVNQGGRFEWTDSVLVKALTRGHWLLIDNVNFCSPSVLDRLNALLEPGGVLTINERGVIDGQVPTITPHPDFRLILAMDPRYGEISRAMRNRGIEIYILGEGEGGDYDDHDLDTLLDAAGMTGSRSCQTLKVIHTNIKQHLAFTSQSHVVDLLRAATLTRQQLQHGADLVTAIRNSCLDVYVRAQPDPKLKQVLQDVIADQLLTLDLDKYEVDTGESSLLQVGLWSSSLPRSLDWCEDVTMAAVRHDATLLLHLVDTLVVGHNDRSSVPLSVSDLRGTDVQWRRPADAQTKLDAVLHVLVEGATVRSWDVLKAWVEQQVELRVPVLADSGQQVAVVRQAVRTLGTRLEAIFKHDLSSQLIDELRSLALTKEDVMTLEEQPFDLRWNPLMVRHLVVAHTKHGGNDTTERLASISSLVNQLLFVSHFRCRWSSLIDDCDVTPRKKSRAVRELTPLQLSTAFYKGIIDRTHLPHPVIVHLRPFVDRLFDNLEQQWRHLCALTDSQLYKLLENYTWLDRFMETCHQPMRTVRLDVLLPSLALHWDWLHRKLLPSLLREESVDQRLRTVINELHSELGIDSIAASHQVSLWSRLGHPDPFQSEARATLTIKLGALLNLLNHEGGRGVRSRDVERIQCLQRDGATVARDVLSCAVRLVSADMEGATDDVDAQLNHLEDVLKGHGLTLVKNNASDGEMLPVVGSSSVNVHKVALWPLFDLLTLRSLHQCLGQLANGRLSGGQWLELERIVEFAATHLSGSPAHLVAPHVLSVSTDKESKTKEILSSFITDFVRWLSVSTVTRGSRRWLHWTPPAQEWEQEDGQEVDNPHYGPYDSLLTHVVMEILVSTSSAETDSWMPSNISLGEMSAKVDQLGVLTRSLWSHAGTVSCRSWTPSDSDRQLLTGSVHHLVQAILTHVDRAMSPEQARQLMESFLDPTTDLDSTLADLDLQQLHVLMPEFTDVFKASLVAVRACILQHQTVTASQEAFDCGKALLHLGLLQTFLLAPQGPVDPAEKKAIKLKYAQEELAKIRTELAIRNDWRQLTSGQDLDLSSPDLHPRIQWLIERQSELESVIKELSANVAIRPDPPQFPALLREVKQFTSSVASIDRVSRIVADLTGAATALTAGGAASGEPPGGKVRSEVKAWLVTLHEFRGRLQAEYALYRDVTGPFLAGISQMLYGVQVMAAAVDTWRANVKLSPPPHMGVTQANPLEQVVVMLGRFPTIVPEQPSLLSLASLLHGEWTLNLVTHLQEAPGTDPMGVSYHRKLTPRVLWSALLQVRNHAWISGVLDSATLYALSRLFSQYVSSWQQAEAERKLREAEKESLYKYKTTTYGEELNEEELEQQEIQAMFPSFEQDFEDITVGPTLEGNNKAQTVEEEEGGLESSLEEVTWRLSDQEQEEVCRVHTALFPALTRTPWLLPAGGAPKRLNDRHLVEPALTCYQVAAHVVQKAPHAVGWRADAPLIGAHLLASHALQTSVTPEEQEANWRERPYDIYRDANIPEVLQCRPILDPFRSAVDKLLEEWPDHPTLKQMVVVMERILSFPVTSPLIKFVTGLEVLLDKGHEWEMNAARHVSLREHTEAVTRLIIQWRKVELKCWRTCLDTVVWRARQGAARWWFHLYQLIEGFMNPNKPDSNKDGGADSDTPEGVGELLPALQQFLEGATLGDYSARLQLVHSFLCQLTHMDQTNKQEQLVRLLWNIHSHYKQFESQVAAEVQRVRAPIEKELKGFVKIARWNDINFYALKQAVEKTHRTLHKHVKAFQSVLGRPVTPVLTDTKSDWSTQKEAGDALSMADDEADQPDIQIFLVEKEQERFLSRVETSHGLATSEVQCRLPVLLKKMRRHCSHVLRNLTHHQHTASLDNFTGGVISTVHDLQKAEVVIQGPEKESLRKDAKFVLQRKRKALSELFKYLSQAGLSYRKGLTMRQKANPTQHLMLPPVDLLALLTQLDTHRCDENTSSVWNGCDRYMRRCVARHALLQASLQTPSSELGVNNIHRCQGFSEHLLSVVIEQRETIATTADTFWNLRRYLSAMHRLATDSEVEGHEACLPPQTAAKDWRTGLKTLCDQLVIGLQQVDLLLKCCPRTPPDGVTCPSPVLPSSLPPSAQMYQEDESWQQVTDHVKKMLTDVEAVKKNVDAQLSRSTAIMTWTEVLLVKEGFNQLYTVVETLSGTEQTFLVPETNDGGVMTDTLGYLRTQVVSTTERFNIWSQSVYDQTGEEGGERGPIDDLSQVSDHVDDFVTSLLLVVQTFVKASPRSPEGEDQPNSCDRDDHQELLAEGHMTKLLHEELKSNIGALELNKISSRLEGLVRRLCDQSESSNTRATARFTCQHMVAAIPLLTQYCHLVQAILTEAVAAHRAMCKLLSVLLAVFTELVTKGFCMPAELSDEMEGDGATQFEDIEGGGMGEGEGAKDVSDQIETEDQLDEARRAGEEREEEDSGQKPDIAPEDNAIEMDTEFDGKMHDLENKEGDEDSNSDNEDQTEQLDKEMGELGEQQADRLDEQIWGSDDEDDKEEGKEDKEEFGPGAGDQTESELVAKDDNQDPTSAEDKKKQEEQRKEEEKDGEDEVNEQTEVDEREYDENEVDPHYGNQPPQDEPEAMDLPDDLNLDSEEKVEEEEVKDKDSGETEENPYDIDKVAEESGPQDGTEEEETEEGKEKGVENDGEQMDTEAEEDKTAEDEKDEEKKDGQEEEAMDTSEPQEGPPEGEPGFEAQVEPEDSGNGQEEDDKKPEDTPQGAEVAGKTQHDTQQVEQAADAQDAAGTNDNEQDEADGTGVSESREEEGHEGNRSTSVTRAGHQAQDRQQSKRQPGKSDSNRTVGTADEKVERRLKTIDRQDQEGPDDDQPRDVEKSDLYEHVRDAKSRYDTQTMDAADADQEQATPAMDEEKGEDMNGEDEVKPDDTQLLQETSDIEKLSAAKLKPSSRQEEKTDEEKVAEGEEMTASAEVDGEKVDTTTVRRGPTSTIHTSIENYMDFNRSEVDVEQLRRHLEEELHTWNQASQSPSSLDRSKEGAAEEAWQGYEAITSGLSQELCEQLRLVLEPTQASKLRGDYRTGKRLNMRKVIPYIASQFRKDKIWLRRTKPSKRQYQVMIAVDDSSSMADNHSKQLAFESVAVVANALTLLEVGELAISSFGESVKLLHPFHAQFTNQSGARILQQFTFEQKKTKIAQLLKQMSAVMTDARSRQRASTLHVETSQLLLVVSDGRGLFLEGVETVKAAVRQAREANIFIVFVIIDNPDNKDSILDIRVPVFKGLGQMPEIRSYMDHFPFPFYIILRDINSLPTTLSDALRQWFELVTATDK